METRVLNVIVPEVFGRYIQQNSVFDTELFRSGIIRNVPEISSFLDGGSKTFTVPFWNDLIHEGNLDEVPDEANDVETDNIDAGEFVIKRQFRVKKWGSNDITAVLAGEDPMEVIARQVMNVRDASLQAVLFSSIQGVLASNVINNGGDMINDLTGETGTDALIGAQAILDTTFILGSQYDNITALAMHSTPYARLVSLNLIDVVIDSTLSTKIKTYQGKRVIVNDKDTSLIENIGGTNKRVYYTILFREGAFGYGESFVRYTAVETERNPNKGGGIDMLHHRRVYAMHPEGFSWTDNSVAKLFPTNAELAMATNWERKFELKNIGFVCLKTLG